MINAVRALNAVRIGDAQEVVVFAHGFGTDQGVWRPFLTTLPPQRGAVLYDLACAPTADPEYFDQARHHTLEGHVEDLLEILARLGVRQCSFVGHSVSGMIGVLAAIQRPDLFKRLILIGASARYTDAPGYRGGFSERDVLGILDSVAANFREWANSFAPHVMDKPLSDPASQTFAASLRRMKPDLAVVMLSAILLSDYRSALGNCTVPAVVLQTRQDPAVPLEAARYLHEHLEGSRFEILDAAGHLPHVSSPEVTAEALRRYL